MSRFKDGMVSPSLNPNAVEFPGPSALFESSETSSEPASVELCPIEIIDCSATTEEFQHSGAQVEYLKACNSKLIDVVKVNNVSKYTYNIHFVLLYSVSRKNCHSD